MPEEDKREQIYDFLRLLSLREEGEGVPDMPLNHTFQVSCSNNVLTRNVHSHKQDPEEFKLVT